jgi:hypothetical protein
MRRCVAVICSTLMSLALPVASSAQQRVANDTLGFWVIGRDAPTREWASEWIERTLRRTSTRPTVPALGWKPALLRLLDVDPPDALGDPPNPERRSGPMAHASAPARYPWDMTREVSVGEMIERLHDERLGIIVQVVVHRYAGASTLAADSVYGLEALAIAEKGLGTTSKRVVILASSSGFVEDRRLQEASRKLGERLTAMWVDLMAAGPVRAR